ncbi:fungal-specific transcription factor domain-containing protein [Mycena metata]|uniref:Fungal-specific transcription factor domain-containing protein n=1 Tax=Mycena metata TaxID=1033252 RepID=A0AAD7HSX0_9AGAR|nr:fungal-specific transcription factor domain-containing protein [Mycena metata]
MERAQNGTTRKKAHRPCDLCRAKKRRHCVKHEHQCTYQQKAMVAKTSYVHSLEERLKSAEALLREPNVVSSPSPPSSVESPPAPVLGAGIQVLIRVIRRLNTPLSVPGLDDLSPAKLSESLQSLSINNPSDEGFQGKSSHAMLIKAVVDLKSQSIPSTASRSGVSPPAKPWCMNPGDEEDVPHRPNYGFPNADLMLSLISNFFSHVNVFLPILHRPSFERSFKANQHLHDDGFTRTLLLVCALGARCSDDSRVELPGTGSRKGWEYFSQVQLTIYRQPTLYDLQCCCLAAQFLDRASGLRAAWTLVGVGLRLGQDLGAHRAKNIPLRQLTPEQELERRTYWALVLLDTQYCAALERSIGIQAHDFDLDPPVQCDDEYWEVALNAAFCQPLGKSSLIDYFACQLTLNRVLSFTLKCLYCNNRMKVTVGMTTREAEEKVVMELDSALNTWADSVPAHLRWDPSRELDVFFDQSAALSLNYYLARIFIHRPLIPAVRPAANPSGVPSLTICNNAARACSRIAELQHRRRPHHPLIFGQTAVFTAGIVLLLNIWGGKRTGRAYEADLADVHRCVNVLRAQNESTPTTVPLADTLEQLMKVDRAPVGTRETHKAPHGSSGDDGGATTSSLLNLSNSLHWPAFDPALETPDEATQWLSPKTPHFESEPPGYSDTVSPGISPSFPFPFLDASFFNLPPEDISDPKAQMDMDTAALWSAAPIGFEASGWDSYLNSILWSSGIDQ